MALDLKRSLAAATRLHESGSSPLTIRFVPNNLFVICIDPGEDGVPEANEFQYSQGVGGRLASGKSPLYERAVMRVEGRTNPYTARYMLLGDIAYVLAANELGLTPTPVAHNLVRCLLELLSGAEDIARRKGVGDIVLQREIWVTARVGRDAAAWLHLGRHRAESLRGYLPRMYLRNALFRARVAQLGLCRALLEKALPVNDALAPVYHHLQHAGYTTLGEYLTSFAINMAIHIDRLREAEQRLDLAPPALTSRSHLTEIARRVSRDLGFSRVAPLRQQLHVTEDHFSEPFGALVAMSISVGRLAEDLRLYTTSEFNFFELSDRHASTSSALPQKKNAFGLQLIIGGAKLGVGRLAAQLATSITVSEEADSVYHAGSLYQHCEDIIGWTDLMSEIIAEGQFRLDELARKASWGFAGASEAQDILVFERNMPPRAAHHALGAAVRAASGTNGISRALDEALGNLPEADYLAQVVRGDTVAETALNRDGLRAAQAELDAALAGIAADLERGDPQETAIDLLIERARAFVERKGM